MGDTVRARELDLEVHVGETCDGFILPNVPFSVILLLVVRVMRLFSYYLGLLYLAGW